MKKLESKKINELFYNCFFEEDEIINGRPTSEFTSIKSINPNKNITVALSTKKLNENKKDIIEYVDALPKIEEGNSLDNLYFDKEGNRWCDDIKTLDQLMMLALACQIVSYTTIELGGKKIVTVCRVRENDELKIKGTAPELMNEQKDNQLSNGYTEEEKKLIAQNKIRITQELNEYNEIINTGLGFFGVHAFISDKTENQLDFYDDNNDLLFTKKFEDTDGIVGWDAIFNQRLSCEFTDKFQHKINYLVDGNRHIFLLSSTGDKHYGYRVEITKDNDKNNYSHILVSTQDKNADYVIKRIEISDKDLKVELNNQFGPYGNYEDGEKRYLWYKTSGDFLSMVEDEWHDKGHYLYGDGSSVKIDNKKIISGLTKQQFLMLSTSIVQHPRNKELVLYAVEELEKQLPGIKEFICNNFPLYNFIVESEYEQDFITESIIKATIHEKCNLKNQGKSI